MHEGWTFSLREKQISTLTCTLLSSSCVAPSSHLTSSLVLSLTTSTCSRKRFVCCFSFIFVKLQISFFSELQYLFSETFCVCALYLYCQFFHSWGFLCYFQNILSLSNIFDFTFSVFILFFKIFELSLIFSLSVVLYLMAHFLCTAFFLHVFTPHLNTLKIRDDEFKWVSTL